jgi:hypothetical protein
MRNREASNPIFVALWAEMAGPDSGPAKLEAREYRLLHFSVHIHETGGAGHGDGQFAIQRSRGVDLLSFSSALLPVDGGLVRGWQHVGGIGAVDLQLKNRISVSSGFGQGGTEDCGEVSLKNGTS